MWECIIRAYGGTKEAELHIFGSQGKAEVQKRNFRALDVEVDYPHLEVLAEQVWKMNEIFKSLPSGSMESGTSDLWQSRQNRSAEADLHIFGSPGRDEMRKWPYPYLESWQKKCGR